MPAISAKSGRRYFSPHEKLEITLESMKSNTTLQEVCDRRCVHLTQVNNWRKQLKEAAPEIFADKRKNGKVSSFPPGESPDEMKKIIGDLVIQNNILKKVSGLPG